MPLSYAFTSATSVGVATGDGPFTSRWDFGESTQLVAAAPPTQSVYSTPIRPVTPTFDPKIEANALYGKHMILSALGFARIGSAPAPIVGPYINNGLADFIVSFGVPADPAGTRIIYAIYLDNALAWYSTSGGTLPADGTFLSEPFDFVFKPGRLDQTVCSLETIHFPGDENAYRPQMLLEIRNLPIARFRALDGKPVPYVACDIGDTTDGADPHDGITIGQGYERIAYSPYVGWNSSKLESVNITDVCGGFLLADNSNIVQLGQSITSVYTNMVLVTSNKIRLKDTGSDVTPSIVFDRNSILGGDGALAITRTAPSDQAREDELSTVDPDQDYTIVSSQSKRARNPLVVSASVGKKSTSLPVILDAPTRQALITFDQYWSENARKKISFKALAFGYEVEPGDLIAIYNVADGIDGEVFRVTETLHGANWVVDLLAEAILRCSIFAPAVDPHFGAVVLLLHFDGFTGLASATDFSSYAHTMTFLGTAQIDTSQSLFGGASLTNYASGDGVTTPTASAPEFSISGTNTAPYTIECWAKFHSINRDQVLICRHTGISGLHFMLRQNSDDELQWLTSSDSASYGATLATTSANITALSSHRIAVDKDSTGTVRIYVDGAMMAKSTPADSVIYGGGNTPVTVGVDGLGGRTFDGWIDEVRITSGISRYGDVFGDAGYTVSASPFPDQ